jgi:hypothetical protein
MQLTVRFLSTTVYGGELMDGRQKPDPQTENDIDLNDEQVIDLTQIVEGKDDYDVIDLKDVIEQPDQASEAFVEPEEEIIPLVDAISKEEVDGIPEDADDEIIDLTDLAAATEAPDVQPEAASTQASRDDEVEETVIDLMDVATALEADLVEAEPEVPATKPEASVENTEDEGDVIDLLDVAAIPEGDTADSERQDQVDMPEETVGTVHEDDPTIDLLDTVEPQTADAETALETDDDFTALESRAETVLRDAADANNFETPEEAAETAGPDSDFAALEDDEAFIGDSETPTFAGNQPEASPERPETVAAGLFDPESPSEQVPLSEAQIESALARTIEKIYGEKIEQLMIRAIEKTVTREIAKIKNALLGDDDDSA